MKYLITGAGGQLGSELKHSPAFSTSDSLFLDSSELDITDFDYTSSRINRYKPKIIINCAAYTAVDRAGDEPDKAFLVNSRAVKNLADTAADIDALLVHFSTDYVFPGRESDRIKYPGGYPETAETGPGNIYGKSKLAGEQEIIKSGCSYLLIRVSWLCGMYGDNFVTTMLRLAENRDELQVVNDQWGSPTFVHDLIPALDYLISQNCTGTFHFTSSGIINWFDFASAIFEITNKKVNIRPVSSSEFEQKATRPSFSKLSVKKLEEIQPDLIRYWKNSLEIFLKDHPLANH